MVIFLETVGGGVRPIQRVRTRQLAFLRRRLRLSDDEPVKKDVLLLSAIHGKIRPDRQQSRSRTYRSLGDRDGLRGIHIGARLAQAFG